MNRLTSMPALLTLILPVSALAQTCELQSGAQPLSVVELYTSEGCSSCPPADRWLSTLSGQPGVLALSFHVNYWNHLGWTDRFASAATTERQYKVKAALGNSHVYTPQVLLNGKDLRQWSGQHPARLTRPEAGAAPSLRLRRDGNQVTAEVGPAPGNAALAGYWVALQDGVSSQVSRGENAGATLRHDSVVRLYQPVPSWAPQQGQRWLLSLPETPPELSALRIAFVVTDASLTRPIQALALRCAAG